MAAFGEKSHNINFCRMCPIRAAHCLSNEGSQDYNSKFVKTVLIFPKKSAIFAKLADSIENLLHYVS